MTTTARRAPRPLELAGDLRLDLFAVLFALGTIDSYAYASIVRFDPHGLNTREAREFRLFAGWLGRRTPPYRLNLNHLRYHISRVCASAHGATVGLRLETQDGETRDFENVCAEPTMLRYSVIPLAPCMPDCRSTLARWAKGRLPEE